MLLRAAADHRYSKRQSDTTRTVRQSVLSDERTSYIVCVACGWSTIVSPRGASVDHHCGLWGDSTLLERKSPEIVRGDGVPAHITPAWPLGVEPIA